MVAALLGGVTLLCSVLPKCLTEPSLNRHIVFLGAQIAVQMWHLNSYSYNQRGALLYSWILLGVSLECNFFLAQDGFILWSCLTIALLTVNAWDSALKVKFAVSKLHCLMLRISGCGKSCNSAWAKYSDYFYCCKVPSLKTKSWPFSALETRPAG